MHRLRVTTVTEGSAGSKFGLLIGDILDTCDGNVLTHGSELNKAMSEGHEFAKFRIIRDLEFIQLSIPRGKLGIEIFALDCSSQLAHASSLEKIETMSCPSLRDVFLRHIRKPIYINAESPTETCTTYLIGAAEDHFTVMRGDDLLRYPYSQIISQHESVKDNKFTVIVNHLIVYKGGGTRMGLGVGVLIPFSLD